MEYWMPAYVALGDADWHSHLSQAACCTGCSVSLTTNLITCSLFLRMCFSTKCSLATTSPLISACLLGGLASLPSLPQCPGHSARAHSCHASASRCARGHAGQHVGMRLCMQTACVIGIRRKAQMQGIDCTPSALTCSSSLLTLKPVVRKRVRARFSLCAEDTEDFACTHTQTHSSASYTHHKRLPSGMSVNRRP